MQRSFICNLPGEGMTCQGKPSAFFFNYTAVDNFLRNIARRDFTHFSPKGWSIETSGTTSIVKTLLPIIREIEEGGWAFRHMESDDKIEMLELVRKHS